MTAPGTSLRQSAIAPIMPSPLTATTVSPAFGAVTGELAGVVEVAGVEALEADAEAPQRLLRGGSDGGRPTAAGGRG